MLLLPFGIPDVFPPSPVLVASVLAFLLLSEVEIWFAPRQRARHR